MVDFCDATDLGYDVVSPEEAEELKYLLEDKGNEALKEAVEGKLAIWKERPLNVAITGAVGVGKSSFIKAIRNVNDDSEEVNETDKTEPVAYPHPRNKELKFWDLPGVGTPEFPKNESYLERVNFERYDFFLIISAVRFTENDIWLAKQIREKHKTFFFIRAQIDSDIDNHRRSRPSSSFNEELFLKKIKDNCTNELTFAGFEGCPVFLLSNFYPEKWDFPHLCDELISCLPKLKQEAMILSLNAFSTDIVRKKKTVLSARIWKTSVLSAAVAAVPIPGLSLVADLSLISTETTFYLEQFGLDDESLNRLSLKLGQDSNLMDKTKASLSGFVGKEAIINLLEGFGIVMSMEEASRYIPFFLGSLISSVISFATTMKVLMSILDKLEEQACTLLELFVSDKIGE